MSYQNNSPENSVMTLDTKYGNLCSGFAASRIGGRSENQDTCACCDTPLGFLVLVCDGMGGGPGGKTASVIAAKTVTDYISGLTRSKDPEIALLESVKLANQAIIDFTVANPAFRGMGSTISALLLDKECAIAMHVGDSRIYQLRGHSVVYRSTDHSKVMELVKAGIINEEMARTSSESNIITQALGHGTEHRPEIVRLPYLKGDRFVLCSDGIWGMFPQKELISMLTGPKNPAGAVDTTVIKVDETGVANGNHHDNLTLAIVDTKTNSSLPVPMNKTAKILIAVLGVLLLLSFVFNLISWLRPGPAVDVTQFKELETKLDGRVKAVDSLQKEIEKLQAEKKNAEEAVLRISDEARAREQANKANPDKDQANAGTPVTNEEILKRLEALEKELAQLDKTQDRKSLVDKTTKELNTLIRACRDNPAAKTALENALKQLADKRNVSGFKDEDLKKQATAITGNVKKAIQAMKK